MPLTTPGSYLPTIDAFLAHWAEVNTAVGGAGMSLTGGYDIAALGTDRAAIDTLITTVADAANTLQTAADERDLQKNAMMLLLSQFRSAVRANLPGTHFVAALPKLPQFSSVESKFVGAFRDMSTLWTQIDASPTTATFTPPMVMGATALADFTTLLDGLKDQYTAVATASENGRIARKARNAALVPVKARLKQYRDAVIAALGPTHVLIASIPLISAPAGHTPDPIIVSGVYNSATGNGDFTIIPPTDPDFSHVSVRHAPGPTYKTDEETVVGTMAAGETTFSSNVGLAAPGSESLFRFYNVLTTGNEKGSATVKIVRP